MQDFKPFVRPCRYVKGGGFNTRGWELAPSLACLAVGECGVVLAPTLQRLAGVGDLWLGGLSLFCFCFYLQHEFNEQAVQGSSLINMPTKGKRGSRVLAVSQRDHL